MDSAPVQLSMRVFDEIFNQRKTDLCDELFASHYVEHAVAPFGTSEPGAVDGPSHMRGVVTWLVDQFPDMQMQVESIVGDDSMAAVLVRSTGTNLGKLNGVIPPTGNTFDAQQSHWYRAHNGKLVEHWAVRDDLTSMIQLGVVSPPGPPA